MTTDIARCEFCAGLGEFAGHKCEHCDLLTPGRNEEIGGTLDPAWLAPSWSGSYQRRRWFMAPVGRFPPRWLGVLILWSPNEIRRRCDVSSGRGQPGLFFPSRHVQ
jgi:hypothetical protein